MDHSSDASLSDYQRQHYGLCTECPTRASYGHPGVIASACTVHQADGMVRFPLSHADCAQPAAPDPAPLRPAPSRPFTRERRGGASPTRQTPASSRHANMVVRHANMGVRHASMGVQHASMGVRHASMGVQYANMGVQRVQVSMLADVSQAPLLPLSEVQRELHRTQVIAQHAAGLIAQLARQQTTIMRAMRDEAAKQAEQAAQLAQAMLAAQPDLLGDTLSWDEPPWCLPC